MNGRPTRNSLLAFSILVLVALGSGMAMWTYAGSKPTVSTGAWPSTSDGVPCDYAISLAGNMAVSSSRSTGVTQHAGAGQDFGSFLTSLMASNKTFCVKPGNYSLGETIKIVRQTNLTLYSEPGARISTSEPVRMLQIVYSSGITVLGGTWVGPGGGDYACMEVDIGSNDITVKGADVSGAGHDGILIRNDTSPNLRISIVGNILHDNGRYGAQDYEVSKSDSLRVLFSGNTLIDNGVGGIYTNGVGGAEITSNMVRNSVGTTRGLSGSASRTERTTRSRSTGSTTCSGTGYRSSTTTTPP